MPEEKPDLVRFLALYKSLGIKLKALPKDNMIQILINQEHSKKFVFTPNAGCVVWFHLDGSFARQVFYST